MRKPGQARHLRPKEQRVAALPAIGRDDDDGAPGGATLSPPIEERTQQLPQTGTPLQSGTAADAVASAAFASGSLSSRVTRVSRVPSVNTSVRRRLRVAACAKRK